MARPRQRFATLNNTSIPLQGLIQVTSFISPSLNGLPVKKEPTTAPIQMVPMTPLMIRNMLYVFSPSRFPAFRRYS